MTPIKAVLLDLSGVLYDGATPLPGAVEAITRLSETGLPVRYVTNTTRSTRRDTLDRLSIMGFSIQENEVFTAPNAVHDYLKKNNLSPFLVVHPQLETEFADLPTDQPPAVVIGDAADAFTYGRLNQAFRLLMNGAPLLAMGNNRYFKENNNLSLDMGPFVAALEFAADKKAQIIGKPAKAFFKAAVSSTGCRTEEAVMVGDDVLSDVIGAVDAGLQGILVKTGKYREKDELQLADSNKGYCVTDISEAVDLIIQI
ncbi:MAG: TIGR01458 family HAD-type hydrolase [Pseudomonadales bacterium]